MKDWLDAIEALMGRRFRCAVEFAIGAVCEVLFIVLIFLNLILGGLILFVAVSNTSLLTLLWFLPLSVLVFITFVLGYYAEWGD